MSYVIKISGGKLGTSAHIYKKYWSEELLSNTLTEITNKDFVFKFKARRWAEKEMLKILIDKKEMEIIDGRG
jgi:hypothetical protein